MLKESKRFFFDGGALRASLLFSAKSYLPQTGFGILSNVYEEFHPIKHNGSNEFHPID